MLQGKDVFEETLYCPCCGEDDVITISTTDFTQVGDNSGWGGWDPVFNKVKRLCPVCGEESVWTMMTESDRFGERLVIIPED